MFDVTTIAILLLGILTGIITGLVPGIPAWLPVFVLLPFSSNLSIEQVTIFWLVSVTGSQFFGSVASIMFKIPGENSSLAYIQDITSFGLEERLSLVRNTAHSSLIAGLLATSVLAFSHTFIISLIPVFGTLAFKLGTLVFLVLVLCIRSPDHPVIALATFMFGVLLSPSNNIALPKEVVQLNALTADLSPVLMLVCAIIIPSLFVKDNASLYGGTKQQTRSTSKTQLLKYSLIGSAHGAILGLLPGPTATISATSAYHSVKSSISNRIIAAEAANNFSVIVGAFLLLYLQIPLSIDAISVSAIYMQNGWVAFNDLILNTQKLVVVVSAFVISLFIFWLAALKSNNYYRVICQHMTNNWVFVAGVSITLMLVDLLSATNSYALLNYLSWCVAILTISYLLVKHNVSTLLLVFGYIFGETLIWSIYQATFSYL